LILLFAGVAAKTNLFETTSATIVSSVFLLYLISMTILLIHKFLKKKLNLLAYFTGAFSIFIGLVMAYLILYVGYPKYGLGIIAVETFPLWIIAFGLKEITEKTTANKNQS
jgi:hypothetical protein